MARPLPHSEEAERAVLGALLLEPAHLARVRTCLQPRDWFVERHRLLYQAFLDVADAGATPDVLTLQAHLEQAGTLAAVGGVAWLAIWGPTGTGKTGLATVLLAEHLRTGKRGRWISGPELSRRIQRDFNNAEDVIAPLLSTSLLVLDEPLTGASADWYTERLLLITRTRDEACLPTIVTNQLLPELLRDPTAATPPPLLSRWLSGLHIRTSGSDVRLRKAKR